MTYASYEFYRYDLFITHEWNYEERDEDLGALFKKLKIEMIKKGIYFYDGEEKIKNRDKMEFFIAEAVRCSRRVLVIISDSLLEKANDMNNFEAKQLRFTTHRRNLVDYAFIEKKFEDLNRLKGTKLEYLIKDGPPLRNMCDEDHIEESLREIFKDIKKHRDKYGDEFGEDFGKETT